MVKPWYLYILRCKNGYLYTGITTDIKERIRKHRSGLGAKSLRGKLPVKLVYFEKFENKSFAAKREREIKDWKKGKKEQLVLRQENKSKHQN